MSDALLIVPPLLKYLAGPLAGPAYLMGSVPGADIALLDLNADWLRRYCPNGDDAPGLVGDHARPSVGLDEASAAWSEFMAGFFDTVPAVAGIRSALNSLCFEYDQVDDAASRLAASGLGARWRSLLPTQAPHFVGVSILWSGQVVAALALAIIVRQRWPATPVVFGGPHITALAAEIARHARYGEHVDGFVAGYAEETFAALVEAKGHIGTAAGVFQAGCGTATRASGKQVRPRFASLSGYGAPRLTLPVQLSRGCAYNQCAFCTYPYVEGRYQVLDWSALDHVIPIAEEHGAQLAIKDALVVPKRLDAIAARIDGRVAWSGCTRIAPRLGRECLVRLVHRGLRTLEVGVESLDPETLKTIHKPQSAELLHALLADAAGLDIHIVINVIAGFPGQTAASASKQLHHLQVALPQVFENTQMSTERNLLEVARNAGLALEPERYGIKLGRTWPWSTVYSWNAPRWCRCANAWQGLHLERAA